MLNRAYIDLGILRENALAVKSNLPSGVKLCAVVKADGYGHGAISIANALYNIADYYAVALVEEGIALRQGGIDKDVLVLIPPFDGDIYRAVLFGLTLTVENVEQVLKIERECARLKKTIKLHVKFNTGMNRLGIDNLFELKVVLDTISSCKWVKLDGMFSHFSAPDKKKALKRAQNKFLLANNLVKSYNNKAICHVSASGGFLKGVFFDMVRVGILLYGYKPFKSNAVSVKPIMKLYAPIIKQRRLKAGESALYGDKRASKKLCLDLVRCGYADGLFRKNDKRIFSVRCMDLSLYYSQGDKEWFCVLGDADKHATLSGTISYEVLTKSAFRAEKIYLN